jgi:hypothetical protein
MKTLKQLESKAADERAFGRLREAVTRMRNGDRTKETKKMYNDALKHLKLDVKHKSVPE